MWRDRSLKKAGQFRGFEVGAEMGSESKTRTAKTSSTVEDGQDRHAQEEGNSSQCRAARTISKTVLVPSLIRFSLVHGANKRSFLQEV